MQAVNEVTRKYEKYLTAAQKNLLMQKGQQISMSNAPTRMQVQSGAIRGVRRTNEMLSNYGLARSLRGSVSSGLDEQARRMPEFQSQMQSLRARETAQLDQYGYQYAQETIAARQRAAEEAERRARRQAAAAAAKRAQTASMKSASDFVNDAIKNGMSEMDAAKYMEAAYKGDAAKTSSISKQYYGSAEHNYKTKQLAAEKSYLETIRVNVESGAMDPRAGSSIASLVRQGNLSAAAKSMEYFNAGAKEKLYQSASTALKNGQITQLQAAAIISAAGRNEIAAAELALTDYKKYQTYLTMPTASFNEQLKAAEEEYNSLSQELKRIESRKITNVGTKETRTMQNEEIEQRLSAAEKNLEGLRQMQAIRSEEKVKQYAALGMDKLIELSDQLNAEKKANKNKIIIKGSEEEIRKNEVDEMLQQIGAAKSLVQQQNRAKRYEEIQQIAADENFAAGAASGAVIASNDTVHKLINGGETEAMRKVANQPNAEGAKMRGMIETVGLMTEEEKAAYNFYMATGGEKQAKEYLAEIETYINERRIQQMQSLAESRLSGQSMLPAWLSGVTQSIASVLATPVEFTGGLYSVYQTLTGKEIDPYDPAFTASIYKNTVRKGVGTEIAKQIADAEGPEFLGNAMAFGYQTLMSVADNLLLVALGSIGASAVGGTAGRRLQEAFTLSTMSMGSAAVTVQEALAAGIPQDQAVKMGAAAGVFEAVFEKISLDNLLDMPRMQATSWIRRTLTQAGVEASEELATEIANIVTNIAVMGDQSDYNAAVTEYIKNGKTMAEARSMAIMDTIAQIGLAAAGGFLSGGMMGGGQAFRGDAETRKIGKAIQSGEMGGTETLLDAAKEVEDARVQKLYAKLSNAFKSQKSLSNLDVGRLNAMVAGNGAMRVNEEIDAMLENGEIDSKTAKQMREYAEELALGGVTPEITDGVLTGKIRDAIDKMEARVQEEAHAEVVNESWAEEAPNDFIMMPTPQSVDTDPARVRKSMGIARNVSEKFDLDVKRSYQEENGMRVSLHQRENLNELTSKERGMLQFARAVQRMGLTDVVVHDHLDVNGAFDPETNTMHIALDAESTIGVMSHELTHYIKKNAPEQYETLVTFLQEQANKARRNGWEHLVQQKMQQYKQEGISEEKLRRLGESEAAAAMCEDMLRDEAKIREFVQRDMTLGEKVLSFIDDVLKNFKAILAGDTKKSEAATWISDIEKARELWFDALHAAKESTKSFDGETELSQRSKREASDKEQELQNRLKDQQKKLNRSEERYAHAKRVLIKLEESNAKNVDALWGERITAQDEMQDAVDDLNEARKGLSEAEKKHSKDSQEFKAAESAFNRAFNLYKIAANNLQTANEKLQSAENSNNTRAVSAEEIESVRTRVENLEAEKNKDAETVANLKNELLEIRSKEKEEAEKQEQKEREAARLRGERTKKTYAQRMQERAQRRAERETLQTVIDRLPTPEGMTDRIENEDLAPAVESFKRTVRTATDLQEDGSYKQRETDVPEAAEYIAAAIKENPMFAFQDAARNLDAFSKNNTELRATLREVIERPFNAAGKVYSANLQNRSKKFMQEMQRLGIKTKKESAAVQRIGEGYYLDEFGEKQIYTMDMLKSDFPNTWENIVAASEVCRKYYDGYIDELNRMLEKVYPNVIEYAEEDFGKASSYVQAAEENVRTQTRYVARIDNKIEEVQQRLASKKRKDTQAYADLQVTLSNLQARQRNAERLLELYEQKAAVRRVQKQQIEDAAASGEILRNRRVQKRADYFHHFTEMEQGFDALMNILKANANIDPALAGNTSQTKPKTRWAGFMQRRGEGEYVEDAVNGMIRYMTLAEYKLAYDPLAEHLRNVEQAVRKAAQEGAMQNGRPMKNANTFLMWIQEWRNGILGKSSAIDRAISDAGVLGRKAIQVARWINSRVKSNAILGNARSALVQVSNVTNASAYIKNPKDWTDGMRCTIQMLYGKNKDELRAIMEQSEFMSQRYMDLPVFDDTTSNAKKMALWMLEAGDKASAHLMWWSAYSQFARNPNVANSIGAGGFTAAQYADEIVRRSIGGRGVGEMPTILNSQIVNMLAPFQIEVTNTFNNIREQLGKKNWSGLMAFEVTTFALNAVFQSLFGDSPLPFDFIGAIVDAIKDISDDDDETIREELSKIPQRFGGEIASGIPFGTQLASLLLSEDAAQALFGDEDPTRYGTGNMGFQALSDGVIESAEFLNLMLSGKLNSVEEYGAALADRTNLLKVALPWGGAQVARTLAGIGTVAQGYSQKLNAEGELEAQFTVDGNILKGVQAAAFGKWSLKEAQEYLDRGGKMSAETTKEMKEAKKEGIAPTKFAEIRSEMGDIKPIKDEEGKTEVTSTTQKLELIRDDADLTDAQKLTMLKQIDGEQKYYNDAAEAFTKGVSVSDYLEYVTAIGRMKPITDKNGKTIKSSEDQLREKLLEDELLNVKQKAVIDELLTDSEKTPDYSNREKFRLSMISENQYKRALEAERNGVSNKSYLKYYELDAEEKTSRDDVYRAIMADKSLTANQKAALETALFRTEGKTYSPINYTDEWHFYITHDERTTLYPMKLELAERQGFDYAKVADYVKRYQTMKDNKTGSGKNGAVKKKDSYAIMADMGFTKSEQKQLYEIMTTKEVDLKKILGKD